jgi:peptide-O-fucosyltransferase
MFKYIFLAFCYFSRYKSDGCSAKRDDPFGPYWDHFGVYFDSDEIYGPLGYDPDLESQEWTRKYPSNQYPVLAFTGAPGTFPIQEKNVHLQKYLKWSDEIEAKADKFIASFRKNENDTFLGIHLRNGADFVSFFFRI